MIVKYHFISTFSILILRLLNLFNNTETLKKLAKYRCYTPSSAAEKDLLGGFSIPLSLAYMYQVAVMM